MTTLISLQNPLTSEDLTALEKFLRCKGQGISTAIQLQGLFCAVLMAPNPVPSYLWRSVVFGESFYFKSNDEAISVLDLVLRFFNQVKLQKESLIESFLHDKEEGSLLQDHELKGIWRIGYAQGRALWKNEDGQSLSTTLCGYVNINAQDPTRIP